MRTDVSLRAGDKAPIGYHHFALIRGWFDNLPLGQLGALYLETGADSDKARKELGRVRLELVAAARNYQAHTGMTPASVARLLRLDPERFKIDEKVALTELPSLEEFRVEHDPTGFYGEAELIEEFERRYSSTAGGSAVLRKSARNERLRKLLVRAIGTLEPWIVQVPKPGDALAAWLSPLVTRPLGDIGITTFSQLVDMINQRGFHWYRHVQGFGATRGKALLRWLQTNKVLPISQTAIVPYRQIKHKLASMREPAFGLVPLEFLWVPADIDGSAGTNRSLDEAGELPANDVQAVVQWLSMDRSESTKRAYLVHLERFMLWMLMEKRRPLSSANKIDCDEYLQFLKAFEEPGTDWRWQTTRSDWVCTIGKAVRRTDARWRPFADTTLSRNTVRQSVVAIRACFKHLVDVGYLRRNPWAAIKPPPMHSKKIQVDRALNPRQWGAVMDALVEIKDTEPRLRMAVLLWMGYGSAVRLHEMALMKRKHLYRAGDGSWEFHLVGKGDKAREVPIIPELMNALCEYMDYRGHGRTPTEWKAELPLITSLGQEYQHAQDRKDQPLSHRALLDALKLHFFAAADRIENIDIIDAAELRRASTHWLRHTSATEMINRGAPVTDVQELLGHADSATTALYVHSDRKRKRAAISTLSGPSKTLPAAD